MSSEIREQTHVPPAGIPRWWVLWPLVALVPHLLYLLQADFVAMLTMYVAWPATMGPLALLFVLMWQKVLLLNSAWGWLMALALAGAWSGAMILVWRQQRNMAWLIYLLSLVVTAVLMWQVIVPPT